MVRAARFLLLFSIAFLPLYYWKLNFGGLPSNLIEVAIGLAFISTLISLGRRFRCPLWQPILLIVVGMAIGSLIALDHTKAFGILKSWIVVPVLFYWTVVNLLTERDHPLIVRLIALNLVVVAAYSLAVWVGWFKPFGYLGLDINQYLTQRRAFGFFESPNYLAMYLVPLLALVGASYELGIRRINDWSLKWAALLLGLLALALTGSRGGYLAAAAAIAVIIAGRGQISGRARGYLAVGLIVALGLVGVLNHSGSDATRWLIWRAALTDLKGHWLLGIGPGQFSHYLASLANRPDFATTIAPYALHPHNIFLSFWLSGGLLALIGFVWLLVSVVKRSFAEPMNAIKLGALAALTAIVVHGLFDTTFFKNDLAVIFWLVVALILPGLKTAVGTDE